MREKVLLLTAVAVAFGACLGASFHFDDFAIFSDPAITSASGWWEVWRPLQTRPLTYFSFWLNYRLGGQNPIGYHFLNLALHATAVLLLLDTLARRIPREAALIAAAIFAVHPIQTEPVAYVFARSTVLAALLAIVSFREWTLGRHWRAPAWFAAALLAKEEVAAMPVFLLLLHIAGSRDRRQRLPIAVMLAFSAAAALRLTWATGVIAGAGAGAAAGVSPVAYLLAQGIAIPRYLQLLIAPYGFTVDSGLTAPPAGVAVAGWLALAGAAGVAAWRLYRWQAAVWFLGGLILLAPTSSIFPAADLAVDRRMYFPLIAFSACAGLLLRSARPVLLTGLLIALVALSAARSQVWMNEERLWTEAVERAPEKVRPRVRLARVSPPVRAVALLKEAIALAPRDPLPVSELGRLYLDAGRPDLALGEYGRALALAPSDAKALNNRGVALAALGQTEAARSDFERALHFDPCQPDALINLKRLGVQRRPPHGCRFAASQQRLLE